MILSVSSLGRGLVIAMPLAWLNSLTALVLMFVNNRKARRGRSGYREKSLNDFMNAKDRFFHSLLWVTVPAFFVGLALLIVGF